MTGFLVPPALASAAASWDTPAGPTWLAELPARVDRLTEVWGLVLETPYLPGGVTAYVAPALCPDGTEAVLKVSIPHREAEQEGAALHAWDGDGAVRLYASDTNEHALLLERCRPGTPLSELARRLPPDEVLGIGAEVLRRLWRSPPAGHPFEPLGNVTAWFADLVVARQAGLGHPFPEPLVAEAVEALRGLPSSAPTHVLLHHDFHPGNVLRANRQNWLAIDPKPQVGDPAFDPVQLILQTTNPLHDADPRGVIQHRLAHLGERLSLDPDRIRRWGLARCIEWGLWSLNRGDHLHADESVEFARIFAGIRC